MRRIEPGVPEIGVEKSEPAIAGLARAPRNDSRSSNHLMSALFSPFTLRSLTLRNRIVIAPMCQYSADDGVATDWHVVHLGRFALGGAALVFTEATAVSRDGRITPGCTGIWDDKHIAPFARVTSFIRQHGALPGIQLAHAGRKASRPRPWDGIAALPADGAEPAWPTVGPSAVGFDSWPAPAALDEAGREHVRQDWRAATRRARAAGFEVVEVHAAHGYLLHEFLSPLSNKRNDRYGGDLAGRMRFPLEIIAAVREEWPADKPVFVRVSATDRVDNGWTLDDTVAFAREIKALGADVMDCSSGGNAPMNLFKYEAGYQVPFAERVRRETGLASMAVGLITEPQQAEDIVSQGRADLVAIAREALFDPNWPLHAARALGVEPEDMANWPLQVRSVLAGRERQRRAAT